MLRRDTMIAKSGKFEGSHRGARRCMRCIRWDLFSVLQAPLLNLGRYAMVVARRHACPEPGHMHPAPAGKGGLGLAKGAKLGKLRASDTSATVMPVGHMAAHDPGDHPGSCAG